MASVWPFVNSRIAVPTTPTYAIYVRVASDRQADFKLRKQELLVRDFAWSHGLHVTHTFIERGSGTGTVRPMFDDLIRLIETNRVDGVLCWDVSPLSRDAVRSARLQSLIAQNKLKAIVCVASICD